MLPSNKRRGRSLKLSSSVFVCLWPNSALRAISEFPGPQLLKTLDTIGKYCHFFKDHSSHLVCRLVICIKQQTCGNLSSIIIGRRSCEIIMEKKPPLVTRSCVLSDAWLVDTSKCYSEVSKSNSRKITSFSKTTLLQREPFFTMFYTMNCSPLLVTK